MQATLKLFRGKKGWHWRLTARNGKVLAVGAEPFANKWNARRAFWTLIAAGAGSKEVS